jgi:hypothetical protein
MLVVLDTNIIAENWAFDKSYHRAFIDFISTVNCEVVFPQIVWSEVRAVYCAQLRDALNKQASANRNLSKHFINDVIPDYYAETSYISVEKSYNSYSSSLLSLLQCGEHSIIEYPEKILPVLAEKAIARMKPFGNSGEEFRDAILWHSVLELAKEYEDLNPVVFISKNTREFSDVTDKTKLHPELQYEISQLGDRKVLYYSSMEEFIKAHQEPIEHFNWNGIKTQLKKGELEYIVFNNILEKKGKIIEFFRKKHRDIIIDVESEKNQLALGDGGLMHYSNEEIIYAYKNGDVSLFVELGGYISFDTNCYPIPSEISISKYDGITNRTTIVDNFSSYHITLKQHFYVQIEFILKGKELLSTVVISVEMGDRYVRPDYDGEDNDLPF